MDDKKTAEKKVDLITADDKKASQKKIDVSDPMATSTGTRNTHTCRL